MIAGNPYTFAIIAEVVDEWNPEESTWRLGLLFFCVDGALFPNDIRTATLNAEIRPVKDLLKSLVIDKKLFNMEKEEAFVELYYATFPENWNRDNDWRFHISPLTMSDARCDVFAVSDGKRIRILASKVDYIREEERSDLTNLNISETYITNSELNTVIEKLEEFLQ